MIDNKILGAVIFLAIVGIFFLGNGITGMTIGEEYVKPLCVTNEGCPKGEACCYFQNADSGICDISDRCASVGEMTYEKYGYLSEPKDTYKSQFVIGIIILVSIFVILYYSARAEAQKD